MKYIILFYILSIPILWMLYLSVMNLKQSRDSKRLTELMIKPSMCLLYFGLLWDIIVNIFVVTFIFLELPRELTVSQRLRRLIKKDNWQKRLAVWFAINMLNPFSGDTPHIKLEN